MLKKTHLLLFLLSIILPFIFNLKPIIEGHIPFWYDPGRDMLLAWDNLYKPTLIGPTTGIAGVFYGPFWIWLLSLGMLINKDPRVVDFIVVTLPYFILFPLILWRLSKKIFSKWTVLSLWLLFILSFSGYASQIWSPNLAPLVFLAICYFIVGTDLDEKKVKYKNLATLGFLTSFLLSFLFSLTMVVPVSILFYFIAIFVINLRKNKTNFGQVIKKWIIIIISYVSGAIIGLVPTVLFELKHGFNQTKALIDNLTQGYVNKVSVVTGGLNQKESINEFINRLAIITRLPNNLFVITFILTVIFIVWQFSQKKIKFKKEEIRILLFIVTTTVSVFLIFFTSKNPIFGYRFTGIEILSIFLTGIIVSKIKVLEKLLIGAAFIYLLVNIYSFAGSFNKLSTSSDLSSRIKIVDLIYEDADKKPFSYAAKNAAIYTFDYDYLFKWQAKKYGYLPESDIQKTEIVYLIIPEELVNDKIGFTENRTPEKKFLTEKEWSMLDKSLVIKRIVRK